MVLVVDAPSPVLFFKRVMMLKVAVACPARLNVAACGC
jgi:hypothetical protein